MVSGDSSSHPSGLAAQAGVSSPRFWVGTSGYNYAEWKGSFYPDKISSKKMLPYYAERLATVGINYTFYRMPTERLLQGWSEATPAGFKLTLKAPRRITHDARLRKCGEITRDFCDVAGSLRENWPFCCSSYRLRSRRISICSTDFSRHCDRARARHSNFSTRLGMIPTCSSISPPASSRLLRVIALT